MNEVTNLVPSHLLPDAKDDARPAKNVLGKDDFMKLLMTQLRHQDPMKPMDHHEFGAQLAQFSQLEQLTNIGSGIQSLRTDRTEDSKLQLIGMIGKRVSSAGNEVELIGGQSVTLRPTIKGDLQPSKAVIYDAGGQLVKEILLAGKNVSDGIQWDGKNQDGVEVPAGKYSFRVHGIDSKGQAQEIGTELAGRVTGMELKGKDPILLVQTASGITRMEISKITGIATDEVEPKSLPPQATLAPKPPIITASAEEMEAPQEIVSDEAMFENRGHGFQNLALPMEGIKR